MSNQDPVRTGRASKTEPIVSLRARDGSVVEMLHHATAGRTALAHYADGAVTEQASLSIDGREYVPYSSENNLLTRRVVVLPSAATKYDSELGLIEDVRSFIHRYVDVSQDFEEIAAHYVLLTWGYDVFNELPYLRVRGDYGSGKSRFLLTVGSLCYKPIFASGASTVSPLFRLIDQIGGTLVVDEADFWASDERAEIVKILNNGNAKGFPVLRSEVTPSKEFSPRAFNIFGPKLVATRQPFQDEALESRCLTEVLGTRSLRLDIPISLPRCFHTEAEALRNQLLMYRFHHFGANDDPFLFTELESSPRRAQILAPLLSVAADAAARERMKAFIAGVHSDTQRTHLVEKRVLEVVRSLMNGASPIPLAAIASRFAERWSLEYGGEVAHRWVGSILRRLGLQPHKSHGTYALSCSEFPAVRSLFSKYGLGDKGELGDLPPGFDTSTAGSSRPLAETLGTHKRIPEIPDVPSG